MVYYSLIGFVLIIIIATAVVLVNRKLPEKRFVKDLPEEEFLRGLRAMAREMRIIERGKGWSARAMLPALTKAFALVASAVNKDKNLTEFEKWYYENIYYVKRALDGFDERSFAFLPHNGGEVRVLKFCRYIVSNSAKSLNYERIMTAIQAVNRETPLTYKEITSFRSALFAALIEEIYILSDRLTHYKKMQKEGLKGEFNNKYLDSDIYLHFLLSANRSESLKTDLKIHGINVEDVEFNYNMSVVESGRIAKYLFETIKNLNEILSDERALSLLSLNNDLKQIKCFEDMALPTKNAYFAAIGDISEKYNVSETLVAKKLVVFSAFNNVDAGFVLFYHRKEFIKYVFSDFYLKKIKNHNTKFAELTYISAILIFALGMAVGTYFITVSILTAVLVLIPLVLVAESLINRLLAEIIKPKPLFMMNYAEIPEGQETFIVVSEYITCIKDLEAAIDNLEVLRAGNPDKRLTVALLADLKPADSEIIPPDGEYNELSESRLNGRKDIVVFIRKRVKSGKKYVAWERKRGAILTLTDALISRDFSAFSYISSKNLQKPEYIITLDADNKLNIGGAREMVNLITHPSNKKYDILACSARYNLFSVKTPYSRRFSAETGVISGYPCVSGLFYTLFGKDLFSGKGIFRLNAFNNKLNGALPENKVLSHDLIEGAILNTGAGSVVYEDAPPNFVAERERDKRWIRGDIQLLPFAGAKRRNEKGEKIRNDISFLYKWLFIRNFLAVLTPIFTLAVGVLAAVIKNGYIAFLAVLFLPTVAELISITRSDVKDRKRARYYIKDVFCAFMRSLRKAFLLPIYAVDNLVLTVRTLFKMARKGNLLVWKTFKMSLTNAGAFATEIVTAVIFMPFLCVFAYFIGANPIAVPIYSALFYAVLLMEYFLGLPREKKISNAEKLKEYAEKTFAYFRFMRADGGLISDNLQIKPYRGASETTSPTNIGFQIVAEICGYVLGFQNRVEFLNSIENIINVVEKLPKWQGNLYNWYSVSSLKPVQGFVSSVDSGNFAAALVVLKSVLENEDENALKVRVQRLYDNTNLNALYDKDRKLFTLGFNEAEKRFEGYYDLLASESRLLSFLFAAKNADGSNWLRLGRDYTPKYGNTLYSWSGTAFEYAMPEIFAPSPKGSLLHSSVKNSARAQAAEKVRGVFGRSESGYYGYDNQLRYQYRAFGVDCLALGRDKERAVVAPYATALYLNYYRTKKIVKNFELLDRLGAYLEFGFTESIDMEGTTRVLQSYMTHHQGMTLCSITNYLTDGFISDSFCSEASVKAAQIILTENGAQNRVLKKNAENLTKSPKKALEYYQIITKIEYSAAGTCLTDGNISVFTDARGHGYTAFRGKLINRYIAGFSKIPQRLFFVEDGAEWISPNNLGGKGGFDGYEFSYSERSFSFKNAKKGVSLEVAVDGTLSAEVISIDVGDRDRARVAYIEDIGLNDYDAQNAHPVFNNMFIVTEIIEEKRLIIASRRLKNGEKPLFVGFKVNYVTDFKAETNRFNFIGRNGSYKNPRILFENAEKTEISEGAVLEPCFAFTGKADGNKIEIIKVTAETREEILRKTDKIPDDYFDFATETASNVALKPLTSELLTAIINNPYPNDLLKEIYESNKSDEFLNCVRYNKPVLYRYASDEDNKSLDLLLDCLSELRYFGTVPPLWISAEGNRESGVITRLENKLNERKLHDHKVFLDKEDKIGMWRYAFLILDKRLTLPKEYRRCYIPEESSDAETPVFDVPPYEFKSGAGVVTENGYYLPLHSYPELPFSLVSAGKRGGFISTERGGGIVFADNSHERRITRFDNDPITDTPYEKITVFDAEKGYRINGGKVTGGVLFGINSISYFSRVNRLNVRTDSYTACDGAVKVNSVSFDGSAKGLRLAYSVECMAGATYNSPFIFAYKVGNGGVIYNVSNGFGTAVRCFCNGATELEIRAKYNRIVIEFTASDVFSKAYFCIGNIDEINKLTLEKLCTNSGLCEKTSIIKLITPSQTLDEIFNKRLLQQVINSRLNGKCGYYQLGGATGFRDQLQDVLVLVQIDPERVRNQILYHAARQYREGDVMHWWHEPYFGLRSRISDDKLFLPFATAEYISVTGDKSILDEAVPFLESAPLSSLERSRYECGKVSAESGTLYEHCMRAFKSALNYGAHGLPLMLSGDWNDGMDYIAEKGVGESVPLAAFAFWTIKKYVPYCTETDRVHLENEAEKLKTAVNLHAFDGKQYTRLFGDDGKAYGGSSDDVLNIDLLSQSFAVLSGISDDENGRIALKSAEKLVDRAHGIVKLLAPPLNPENYLGYISSYPKGVRENGGQYTHAAVWYAMALFKIGEVEKGYEIIKMLNPLERCRDEKAADIYKGEPFVISADVYSGVYAGRMGWSWYTGSAAWYYKLISEELFGLKKRGNRLYIDPKLPKELDGSIVEYRDGNATLKISFVLGGKYELKIDGIIANNKKYVELTCADKSLTVIFTA